MARYYVDKNAQPNGDHEVHRFGCTFMPREPYRIYIGDHPGCESAVNEAKQLYTNSNGCALCASTCHTR